MTMIVDNTAKNRFELVIDGQTVYADYKKDGTTLYIKYVEAPVALRGRGASGQLMDGVMKIARQNGVKVVPICGYAASWIRRHTEYHDLLA